MSIKDHLAQPEVSFDEHIAGRAAALAASLANRIPIYLDTRFWIMVREVEDRTSTRDDEIEIVRSLRALVEQGKAYCPIAEPSFSEVMRQAQPTRRAATAGAIDGLSLGVTIHNEWDRMVAEVRTLLHARMATGAAPPRFQGLTSLAYVLGDLYPAETGFPADTELAIQKAFYDRLWDEPLAKIVLTIPFEQYTKDDELAAEAQWLTEQNALHQHLIKSWEDAIEAEFLGAAQCIVAKAPDILAETLPVVPFDAATLEKITVNAIRAMLKDPANARAMSTIHVHANIHALFRWEYRGRAMTANDLVDFRHATAALSHCTLFLTEKGLRNTLVHPRAGLADLHGTTVLASRGEIVRHLRRLAA